MRVDKQKALKLRLKGKSYSEISFELGIPKSTLSSWFMGVEISDGAQDKINRIRQEKSVKKLIERNQAKAQIAESKSREIREKSKKEIRQLSKRELWLIGITLYWAEGHKKPVIINGKIKTSHSVSITSSDPNIVKIFLEFLKNVCGVDENKIGLGLRIDEGRDISYVLGFWSKVTGVSSNRFKKTYYIKNRQDKFKKKFNTLPYGAVQVRVNNTELYHKIMGWIDGLVENN